MYKIEMSTSVLKNMCSSKGYKEQLAGVLFKNGKAVMTDSAKLVEIETGDINMETIIPVEHLKKGDTVAMSKENPGLIEITRKDGSKLNPDTLDASDFPEYQSLLKGAEERESSEIYLDRKFLVHLLEAMPDDYVTVRVPKEERKALHIVGDKSRGLLMPCNK